MNLRPTEGATNVLPNSPAGTHDIADYTGGTHHIADYTGALWQVHRTEGEHLSRGQTAHLDRAAAARAVAPTPGSC